MKDDTNKLNRLFAMARAAGEEPADEMPGFLKARILARLGRNAEIDDAWSTLVTVFRRGLVCAGLVAIFAVAWSFAEPGDASLNDEAMANYELRTEVMQ
jgi:hypothetical protein